VLKLARRPSAESALDPLAEPGELLGRGGCQGPGMKPAAGRWATPSTWGAAGEARLSGEAKPSGATSRLPERLKGEVRTMLTAIEAAMDGEWWPQSGLGRAVSRLASSGSLLASANWSSPRTAITRAKIGQVDEVADPAKDSIASPAILSRRSAGYPRAFGQRMPRFEVVRVVRLLGHVAVQVLDLGF
jgi:hypothetical protein